MNWYIAKVIVYGRNGETREVDFGPGVNIVTGDSKKGKSAILQIVDYCLGASECRIPPGTVRDFALHYGLLIQTSSEQILLVRPDPGIRVAASEMHLRIQPQVRIPSIGELEMTTDYKSVIAELSHRLGLMQVKLADDQDDKDFSGRPSVRDLVAFMFQPQTIIADNETLFYRLGDARYRRRLERVFPLVLGAVDEEYFRLRTEIDDQKKLVQRLEREVQRSQIIAGEGLARARQLWLDARLLHLTEEPLSDEWSIADFIGRLEALLKKKDTQEPKQEVILVDASRLGDLEGQYERLRHELRNLESELQELTSMERAVMGYVSALDAQSDRLAPLKLFTSDSSDHACPVCSQPLAHITREVRNLRSVSQRLIADIHEMQAAPPALQDHRKKLEGELDERRRALKAVATELRSMRAAHAQLSDEDRVGAVVERFLGRAEYYLENVADLQEDNSAQSRLSQAQQALTRLQEQLSQYDYHARLDSALRVVGRHMTNIAANLDLEWRNAALSLDLKRMTVVCDTPSGQPIYLLHMGSAANWVSCHLSALLALHQFFVDREHSPVPSILFLDQASQAYFPPDALWDQQAQDTDRENVKKIFQTVFDTVSATSGQLQVIMIDHADYSDWPEFIRAVDGRRFRGTKGLI